MLLMETNTTSPLWYVLGGVAIAGGLCLMIYLLRNPKPPRNKKKDRLITEIPPKPDPKPVPEQPCSADTGLSDLRVEILKMIKFFRGSMNALFGIHVDGSLVDGNFVFTNLEQIINDYGSDVLKKWFSSFVKDRNEWTSDLYKSKSSQMLDLLKQCGVTKSTEIKVRWSDSTQKHYKKLESSIQDGQVCEVVAPCWIFGNEVFEKGLVRSIKQ